MTMTLGTLVEHKAWGRGKVVDLPAPYVIVHFPSLATTPEGPRRKLHITSPQLAIAAVQSDPDLDRISLNRPPTGGPHARTARPKAPPTPLLHTLDQAIDWFRATYDGLFDDAQLKDEELDYKRKAHDLWLTHFGSGRAHDLITNGETAAIATGIDAVFRGTNIPTQFEMMAIHDGSKDGPAATPFLSATLAFIEKPDAGTFTDNVDAVASLPAPREGSRVLTWPNVTILPFLADPSRFMVLKPQVTRRMARRIGFDLLYSSKPSWHTYDALQTMSRLLLDRLAPLGAQDFIDVQTFIWVTQDLE